MQDSARRAETCRERSPRGAAPLALLEQLRVPDELQVQGKLDA